MGVVERSRIIEPGRRLAGATPAATDAASSLPADLRRQQWMRIEVLQALGVILWTLNLVMDASMAPHGDRGPYRLLIEATGAALCAAGVLWARARRRNERATADAGIVLMVPHAFLLALLNSWTEQPTTMRPVSSVTVLILLFGMIAPARPRWMLAAAVAAASMDPLGVWIAHLRGLPVPSALNTVLMFYPNYVCASLAVAPAQVLYRLGRQVREARALGSYQLVERLGEGGMGEVWRAHHRLLARSAAIKLIRPEILGDSGQDPVISVNRFEREAQATAALTSPHTIRVFDFGVTGDGTFYYVMELLDGRDLESLVREFGPLPPGRAMHVMRQVCRSLAEAHAIGLVHRDIKPANIYACRMGLEYDFVKVLDFGLVRHENRADAPTLVTLRSVTMGTPGYMAPEVILGNHDTDRRADVYALGCVAYFLLTGQPVFEAEHPMKLLMRHVQETPLPPSRRAEHPIPREIDDFVMACLQKDPDRRPHSAEDALRLACECEDADLWDQHDARRWWTTNLPDLSIPTIAAARA